MLESFKTNAELTKEGTSFEDIECGILYTLQGFHYPVIDGIPRMLPNPQKLFPGFYSKWKAELHKIPELKLSTVSGSSLQFITDYQPTLKRFGREWKKHNLEGLTWGLDQETRISHFLTYMDISKEELKNKLILDAGAGSGQLTCKLANYGCTIVGIDLSPSIEEGWRNRKKFSPGNYQNILLVQGNLMNPPFPANTFELIHSSGVLHHTPDTKKAFFKVSDLCKPGGKFAVWLYSINEGSFLPVFPFISKRFLSVNTKTLRKFTPKLPAAFLYNSILTYVFIHHSFYKLNTLLRGRKHEQTVRERVTSLFDCLAPPFVWQHDPEDVMRWFKMSGYTEIKDCSIPGDPDGFNICGVKMPTD